MVSSMCYTYRQKIHAAAQICLLLHVDTPIVDSTKPEELEGTTQLPQSQLELLGMLSNHIGKLCNFEPNASIESGVRIVISLLRNFHKGFSTLSSKQKHFE